MDKEQLKIKAQELTAQLSCKMFSFSFLTVLKLKKSQRYGNGRFTKKKVFCETFLKISK